MVIRVSRIDFFVFFSKLENSKTGQDLGQKRITSRGRDLRFFKFRIPTTWLSFGGGTGYIEAELYQPSTDVKGVTINYIESFRQCL
jgi:hypothetical protein